jgi:soluble lytic murein transglycosylase-like protein
MISVGAQHLKGNLDQAQGNVYEALRLYNSGSVAADGDLSSPNSVGTPSYVNDMANRFHGWISGGN